MSIAVRWYDDNQTILLLTFVEHWMLSELDERWHEVEALLEAVEQPVYLLIDYTESTFVPSDLPSFIKRNYPSNHPKIIMNIIVGANFFVRMMVNTLVSLRVAPFRLHLAATMEEALVFIERQHIVVK
jgi:hypothetical protein